MLAGSRLQTDLFSREAVYVDNVVMPLRNVIGIAARSTLSFAGPERRQPGGDRPFNDAFWSAAPGQEWSPANVRLPAAHAGFEISAFTAAMPDRETTFEVPRQPCYRTHVPAAYTAPLVYFRSNSLRAGATDIQSCPRDIDRGDSARRNMVPYAISRWRSRAWVMNGNMRLAVNHEMPNDTRPTVSPQKISTSRSETEWIANSTNEAIMPRPHAK